MLKFSPIIMAVLYGLLMWQFSAWRLRADLDRRSLPLVDPALEPSLLRLARALGLARVPVHVFDIPQVNGLAAPDGRIFLTRGFLAKFRAGEITADELAGVVAHELGHVALGHARRRMIDFSGQNAVRVVLAAVIGRVIAGFGPWIAAMLTRLVSAGLSRRDEYEADAYATALLIKAGIGAGPQKSLFAKLDALAGRGPGEGPPAWLLSHPKAEERIAAIRANEAKWGVVGQR